MRIIVIIRFTSRYRRYLFIFSTALILSLLLATWEESQHSHDIAHASIDSCLLCQLSAEQQPLNISNLWLETLSHTPQYLWPLWAAIILILGAISIRAPPLKP